MEDTIRLRLHHRFPLPKGSPDAGYQRQQAVFQSLLFPATWLTGGVFGECYFFAEAVKT